MVSEEAMKQADEYKAAGNKLMGLQKFEDAIHNYSKAIELNSENEKFYSNRALAYIKTSKFKRAVADAKKAISLKPDYVNAVLHLAEAEKGHNNYKEAAEAFTKALKLEKNQDKRVKISAQLEECQKLADQEEEERLAKEEENRQAQELQAKSPEIAVKSPSVAAPTSDKRSDAVEVNEIVTANMAAAKEEEESSELSFNAPPEQKEEVEEEKPPCCSKEGCEKFWNVGNIANAVAFVIMTIGVIMLATTGRTTFTLIVFNCGIFAFSGGATNGIAIKMLFDKIPGVAGSGVIPSRFVEIREIVKKMIMKNFFDEVYLSYFLKKKLLRMDFERMINELLQKHDVSSMIVEMAFEDPGLRAHMEKMLRPYVDDMASKFGPLIAKGIKEVDFASGIGSAQGELEAMLDAKLKTLTPNTVKKMIEDIIREHLYWLVMWGAVFGGLMGIICGALSLP